MSVRKREINKSRVAFIQGRPGAHQMHQKFALSVDSEFHFVDFRMRWQDKQKSILYRVMSWVICAITFPDIRRYNVFFVDNLHFMPVIMKFLRLNRKKQKIVAHLGSHTLYFIYSHRFSKLTEKLHIWALKNYDGLICEGMMSEDLVKKILGDKTPRLYTIINGIPEEHFPEENEKLSNLDTNTILFVGQGPSKERMWYKGLDLMLRAFERAKSRNENLKFVVIGDWEIEMQNELIKNFNRETKESIKFIGAVQDLKPYFTEASLYLHCARGEAYGLTVLIAMSYGLPVIVSEWTGTKEIVSQVDKSFITQLNDETVAEQIVRYFNIPLEDRKTLGEKFKTIGRMYTEERAIKDFQSKFAKLKSDFNLV